MISAASEDITPIVATSRLWRSKQDHRHHSAGVELSGRKRQDEPAARHRIMSEVQRLCQHGAMMLCLRLATRDDLVAVKAIVHAAYSHYIARIGREPGPMLDDYASLIEKRQVHVAEHHGSIQGIIVLIEQDETLLLDNMAVAPQAQGAGLGRMMLEFAERVAIERGYSTITLYANEMMTENITRYTRAGYEETHRAEEKGLRRVYMRKPLGKA